MSSQALWSGPQTMRDKLQIRPFAMIDTDARAMFVRSHGATVVFSLSGGVRYTDEHKDLDSTGGVYRIRTEILAVPPHRR